MGISNIYLARHGQTEYNRCNQIQGRGIDISLNNTGRRQARAIANHLNGIGLSVILSSSLKRSYETAQIIAEKRKLTVQSYHELDEMDFGELEGKPIADIKSELEQLQENWRSGNLQFKSPQGESPQTVYDRAARCAKAIINKQHDTNLLFVLHGRLIRILVSGWLNYGLTEMHRVPHTNGALYHLQWDGNAFESVYLNNTDHLGLAGQQE